MNTYIIAELSGNHGGKLENALRLIKAAIDAGADAVKFQCFDPERLARKRNGITWEGKALFFDELVKLYRQTHTPRDWFPSLISYCADEIAWFSSVFDPDDVAFLEGLNCPRYKISAYEMLDGDLINAVRKTGKPIIMSVRPRPGLTLLRASHYDGQYDSFGISDHSLETFAIDAPMVERHICLPEIVTPDSNFSLTPKEFSRFVKACRENIS